MFTLHRIQWAHVQQFCDTAIAPPTPFQSLQWLIALQQLGHQHGYWWCVMHNNTPCAVFFLGITSVIKRLWHNAHFQRTGCREIDRANSEYNDAIYSAYGYPLAPQIRQALPQLIWRQYKRLYALQFDYIIADHQKHYVPPQWHYQVFKDLPTWGMPLSLDTDVMALFSSNLRRQLRKDFEALQSTGTIECVAATDATQALQWFNNMLPLNYARHHSIPILIPRQATPATLLIKGNVNRDLGCMSSSFIDFHQHIIAEGMHQRDYNILHITHNNTTLGYCYYLLNQHTAYYYMSGFNYAQFAQYKVGMLCHVLAASYYASSGYKYYDFMAGSYRYKQQMGQHGTAMVSMVLHPPCWHSTLYLAAQRAWRKLKILNTLQNNTTK